MNPIIKQAIDFTDTYIQHQNSPKAIREAMCYKAQYPALLQEIRDGDMFAGRRTDKRIAYIGSVWWFGMPGYSPKNRVEGKQGGYCFDFAALYDLPQNSDEKEALKKLTAFWENECTTGKVYQSTEMKDGVGFLIANNLDKLVSKGLPGLVEEVTAMPESDFRAGLIMVLETVMDVCHHFHRQAMAKGMHEMAQNVLNITKHAPKTLAEALQLILIYELLSHEKHYELNQLDVALGDLYAKEVHDQATKEKAINQIHCFYKMIRENGEVGVCRLFLGGKNRRNQENADRFIEAALLAEQRHKDVIPQVSLRIYTGMNPELLTLAYDTINVTYTFPTLFNDDTIPAGAAEVFGISLEEAEKSYYPLGCGELILANKSPAFLCTAWNAPQTINDGIRAANATNFEELYQSVLGKIREYALRYARYHKLLEEKNNEDCAYLMVSLLTDDCIARGKPLLDGGARYMGACIMGHGFTNGADSLTAIKKVVYEDKTHTLAEIIQAMDANFVGYEHLHKTLMAVPKYGNDNDEADKMVSRLWRDMSNQAQKAGEEYGFDFLTVSSVNPGGYWLGMETGATADGRLAGQVYAIGNAPTAGQDKNGLTALMNSVIKTDPVNGGTMTNFKISRSFFVDERAKFEALFGAYWAGGGLQANITIMNKGDLEAAMKEPEKYPHLLVRLGGWTSRFIDLDRYVQKEILTRTLY